MDRIIGSIIARRKAVVAAFLTVAVVCAAMIPFVGVNYDMVDYLPDEAQSTTAVSIMNDEFAQAVPNASVLVHDVGIAQALALKHESLVEASRASCGSTTSSTSPCPSRWPTPPPSRRTIAMALRCSRSPWPKARKARPSPRCAPSWTRRARATPCRARPDTAQTTASTSSGEAGGAALILVPVIILLLVLSTTSWIEPLLFIAAIGVSILTDMGTNIVLGRVSFITFSVSPILQLAVSLDYAIFLLHAFAAERQRTPNVERAMALAMRRSLSTIAASAVTTLFGFAALAFMQFQIGADLGINLVKGIVFSFFTVMVFLPAVTLSLYKLIDKTRHRPLMPSFKNVGKVLSKVRVPALVLVLALVVPAFLGQSHTVFTYQNSEPDPNLRAGADTLMIQDEFGQQNAVVVLVPRGDVAAEAALSRDLAEVDHVTGVISYASTVGAAIPQGFLDQSVIDQFYSPNYARIIAYTSTDVESDEAFSTVEAVRQAAARHCDTYYTAGQSANLYDMWKNIVAVDNVVVAPWPSSPSSSCCW